MLVQRAIDALPRCPAKVEPEVVACEPFKKSRPTMNGYMMAFSKVKMRRFEFNKTAHLLFNPQFVNM